MYAPFEPSSKKTSVFDGRPHMSTPMKRDIVSNDYVGHIYSFACTIPEDYLYWFSPSPRKTLTVTGESKSQVLLKFRSAILSSKVGAAASMAVELHCSGYFPQAFSIIIEIIGSHIHIHNPNIASHIVERYEKFRKQLGVPNKCGTTQFPDEKSKKTFFSRVEVQSYRSTINCQTVRNFVMEIVSIVCLSHQKEMALPRLTASDITDDRLIKAAISVKVGGKKPERFLKKKELALILKVIEKYLLYKLPKVEDSIYWVLWLVKFEKKCKQRGEKLPCKAVKVKGVPRSESDHWVWYIWKSLFIRVNFYPLFKKIQIANIYYLFRVNFKKNLVICRLPLLFFAMRLLKYDVANNFPSVINQLHLYVQACANVNVLYRNLQIRLARKSWVDVIGEEKKDVQAPQQTRKKPVKKRKTKKLTKKEIKEFQDHQLSNKTAYLDILPRSHVIID